MTPALIYVAFAICALPAVTASCVRLLRCAHILQLEEYSIPRYLRWVAEHRRWELPSWRTALVVVFFLEAATGAVDPALIALALVLAFAAVDAGWLVRRQREPAKKPLRPTPRLLLVLAIAAGLALLLGCAGGLLIAGWQPTLVVVGGSIVLAVLAEYPAWLLAGASLALSPLQALAREAVVAAARFKLARSSAIIVAITGSYGKTSTKEILASLLATKYRVLKTPESYNTLLGVSRVILRQLRPEHQVFVVEMGAYQRGEIRRLCRLAPPHIGILTAINPQHLERFGSLENIALAKYELIEALPADGAAVVNVDNERCRERAEATRHVPVIRYGLDTANRPDVTALDTRSERLASRFTLVGRGGDSAPIALRLLGRHNIANFVGAAAAAMAVGMTADEVARAAGSVEPVPHRLQPVPGAGGVTVLDDAYNSNPDGARAALEVLRGFGDARKVLVTPGMIELGEREEAENRQFGVEAAAVCNDVILVGPKRTEPIRTGLVSAGFPADRIHVVRTIQDATTTLAGLVQSGDVVLFENDLPDNYNES